MTFNDDARIDTSKVQRRRGGRAAVVGGGGALVVLLLALVSPMLGVDLTPLASVIGGDTSGGTSNEQTVDLSHCETGAAANESDECRMVAATDSIDTYWETQVRGYRAPEMILYDGTTQSACGTASNSVGPFYCPSDEGIYIDTAFYDTLRSQFGASAGSLAQMYVLAHEWGHHISNLTGQLKQVGNDSGPASGSVRLELQADCYAGSWVGAAATIKDANGQPFLEPVTKAEIADALDAAAAVGDDHIQQSSGQRVNPEAFTHGSSEQRQRWFAEGYQNGPAVCDTFSVSASKL